MEPSRGRIRLIPYGIRGRLRWSDFDASPSAVPSEGPAALVEWVVPMPK